jgi:hypothetical protein
MAEKGYRSSCGWSASGSGGRIPGDEPRLHRAGVARGERLAVADSYAICEYLEEAYPDTGLFGRTLAERAEVRRLVAWFDGKFAAEVTTHLLYEKQLKRLLGRGNPDASAIRVGYANMRPHLEYLGWLAERAPGWPGRGSASRTSPPPGTSPRSTTSATSTGAETSPRSSGTPA